MSTREGTAPSMPVLARTYADRFMGFRITPLTRRRLRNFRANKLS